MSSHLVVGTAGHIDHGKTTLVRALTGVDLDTLPEERARGITIALGFTHLDLGGDRTLSFVDVPGHERLVRTMIAGATGLDAVLLCVSAVEGVMPQTREHLDILRLLGVRQGLCVLTMADLVDEEMLALATMDVEEAVAGSFLDGAPILAVAVPPDGAPPRGLDALRAALATLAPAERSATGPFRLPIDRAFVRRGFGTVVTGTLRSGELRDGDEVEVLPDGIRTRVRGLQVHGHPVAASQAGQRTAVNLAGVERDDLARGQVLVHPGRIEPASVIDCRVHHLPGAPALPDGARVRLLSGTAEVMAALSVIDGEALAPGQDHLVQLRTEAPLVLLPGDRLVLRRESPVETLGGGEVLDPWAPRARRRDHARVAAELRALLAGDRSVLLSRAGDTGLSPARAALLGVTGGAPLGDRLVHPDRVAWLQARLGEALDTWHRERPLTPGAPRRDLRRGPLAHLDDRAFDALVALAAARGELVLEGPVLRRPTWRIQPTAAQQAVLDGLRAEVAAGGLDGVSAGALLAREPDAFMLLVARGDLVRMGDRVVDGALLQPLLAQVRAWFDAHAAMSPTEFKDLSGLSRRMAIPLLEWLDASGLTSRQGDQRVAGPALRRA
ncbi:selenocysteine-specific translation elongation factor [Myxococcota bacterium]|nr:selenocysteine-specific translation elongation factor [Myxococcota bacterium]